MNESEFYTARVIDFDDGIKTDSEIIESCLDFLSPFAGRTVIFDTRDWHTDRAVLIPSNTTVIIDGVMIKQNDYVFDNVFRADNLTIDPNEPNGYPVEVREAKNIRVLGKNGAVISGPDKNASMYHPKFGEMQEMIGDYWGWRGFLISVAKWSDFEIANLSFVGVRSWTISAEKSRNGYLHDLDFFSTVKNGDGINLRVGCSHILIERISGQTSDDLIAINTSGGFRVSYPDGNYVFPLFPTAGNSDSEPISERYIHDICVRDVVSKTLHYSQAVAFLCRHNQIIENIYLENIRDGNPVSESKRLAIIGTYYGYCRESYSPGDLRHIRINNIISNSAKTAVVINDIVSDVKINRVTQHRPDGEILKHINDDDEITVTNSTLSPDVDFSLR